MNKIIELPPGCPGSWCQTSTAARYPQMMMGMIFDWHTLHSHITLSAEMGISWALNFFFAWNTSKPFFQVPHAHLTLSWPHCTKTGHVQPPNLSWTEKFLKVWRFWPCRVVRSGLLHPRSLNPIPPHLYQPPTASLRPNWPCTSL